MIWKRLTHPNVLPVLGVSPKPFQLCIVSEWIVGGNVVDFTSKHPEVNRLRLVRPISISPSPILNILKLAEAASGLQFLHSGKIIHGDLKPVRTTTPFLILSVMILHRQTFSSTVISTLVSLTTDSSLGYRTQRLSVPVT